MSRYPNLDMLERGGCGPTSDWVMVIPEIQLMRADLAAAIGQGKAHESYEAKLRQEIERLQKKYDKKQDVASAWKDRVDAAENRLSVIHSQNIHLAGDIEKLRIRLRDELRATEAKLAEAQAELAALKAAWKASDAAYGGELAAERAKTAKLVEALEAIDWIAGSNDAAVLPSIKRRAIEALAAAKASETCKHGDAWFPGCCAKASESEQYEVRDPYGRRMEAETKAYNKAKASEKKS